LIVFFNNLSPAIVSCGHAWARRAQSYFGRGHAVPTLPPCQSASVGTHMPVRRPK